jgi:cell division septum initiation protein DivIVA
VDVEALKHENDDLKRKVDELQQRIDELTGAVFFEKESF